MTFSFRPAVRENVPLLIGVAGGTGAGKTMSALRLATGLAGGQKFAVIDTEAGRAKHYADVFEFDHGDLTAPFTPQAYTDAIKAADEVGYPVVVVDSASHEHAGDGGLLDMHDAEFERMGRKDSAKMSAWIKPKAEHKKMVTRLLQMRAHVILCFRAEEKIEIVKDERGKTVVRPKTTLTGLDGWVPIAEKTLPYELTLSILLTSDAPGIPKPIKLQEQHRAVVPLDKPLDEDVGLALGNWAAGQQGTGLRVASPSPADPDGVIALSGTEKLEDEILKLASEFGADVPGVHQAIERHRKDTHPPVHLEWLKRQKATLEENIRIKNEEENSPFKAPAGATSE